MKSLLLNGRMTLLRKTSCLLTILFAAVATVFLLVYPLFVENTRAELEHAYDSIEVSGWLFNGKGFDDPSIDGDVWHALLDTDGIGAHYSYSTCDVRLFDTYLFDGELQTTPQQAEEAFVRVEKELTEKKNKDQTNWKTMKGLNVMEAHDSLARVGTEIQWLEGYSADCLTGAEAVCLVPESMGFQPGDWVPFRLRHPDGGHEIFCMQAVGVFPLGVSNAELILPLQTLEALCAAQGEKWDFWLNGFSFLVKDNRALPRLKEQVIEMGLTQGALRAAIDDRILDGTVSPIQSNLAMLEGLYSFFFAVVAVLGFFLCYLQTRSRKQEYAVMRLLGESSFRVTWKAILEQLLLSLLGVALGAAILLMAGQGAPDLATCGIILACYILGAAIAVILTVRVNVMEILRDKE